MASTAKKNTRKAPLQKKPMVVSEKVKGYVNDPFFVKKAKAMEAVLKKHGLPDPLAGA
jgi:hypothetical protein